MSADPKKMNPSEGCEIVAVNPLRCARRRHEVPRTKDLKGGRLPSRMGTGGLNYVCPTCGNPLFFTFRVVETKDGMRKRVHCPGCRTVWVVDLKMVPETERKG